MVRSTNFFRLHLRQSRRNMTEVVQNTNKERVFKRHAYTIGTKIEMLDLYHKDKTQCSQTLSQKHINPTTFALWLRKEAQIRSKAQTTDITHIKRYRASPLNIVDDGLYRWFSDTRASQPYRKIHDQDLLIAANQILDKMIETGVLPKKRLSSLLENFSDVKT